MELDRDLSGSIGCCVAREVRFLPVPFIDVAHGLTDKRATGRLPDLADVEALSAGIAGAP